jgi:hypothetical protein
MFKKLTTGTVYETNKDDLVYVEICDKAGVTITFLTDENKKQEIDLETALKLADKQQWKDL